MANIIEVEGLGKKYKQYATKSKRVWEWISGKNMHDERWVLKDISFNVSKGESIGIVGHNGAGKSTLLKIITGTTTPTTGSVRLNGHIAALLELGMGFHPDFTGMQNIFMAAQLMGLNNEQINELIPEIRAFSELGDYLNQPIRTYSSGMVVRLGFSVATSVRPDILIVDEALSVGDAYFQHKCFDRIKRFKEEGTTIFFVSHDPGAVKNLCDRALLLDHGQMIKEGKPDAILDYYNAIIAKQQADYEIQQSYGEGNRVNTRSGNNILNISEVYITNKDNKKVSAIQVGEPIILVKGLIVVLLQFIQETIIYKKTMIGGNMLLSLKLYRVKNRILSGSITSLPMLI